MSLRGDEALYHVSFKIGQRSAGRSAVAAAAYRAAEKLVDRRTGRTFDYSRKSEVQAAFILAPEGAPDWTQDRGELWSRAELAEKRRDAQTWRELELALPRDIPAESRRALIEDVVRPYVEAGAIVDVAIHTPSAADGSEQPHAHCMMSLRSLAPDTETGFAATKNKTLASFFEGRDRRAGIKAERERIAAVLNEHLARHGSQRRADHRSYADRQDARTPEAKIGERSMRRHHRHHAAGERPPLTDVQRSVIALRHTKILQHQIDEIDAQLTKENPTMPTKPQIKERLLKERYPDAVINRDHLHMVDVKHQERTRIQTLDGGWIEAGDGAVRIYREDTPQARALASALAKHEGITAEEIEYLPASLAAGMPGKPKPGSLSELERIAEGWRERGFTDITVARDGVWIGVGKAKLCDTGNRVTINGPVSDDAVRALITKAKEDWGGQCKIWGDDEFKAKAWLEAQRQGVQIINYNPPPHVREMWEREKKAMAQATADDAAVAQIADTRALAREIKAYASGESDSLSDPQIAAAIDAMPDRQRAEIASASNAVIMLRMQELRASGAEASEPEAQDEPDGDPEPRNDDRPRRSPSPRM